MAWSSDFLEALAARQLTPIFVLEVLEVGTAPGSSFNISSHTIGGVQATHLAVRGVSAFSSQLNPRGWSTQVGNWSVQIVDLTIMSYCTRGSIVRLQAGFPGWDLADYQDIALGQVWNIIGAPPVWTVEVMDLGAVLRDRLTPEHGINTIFAGKSSDQIDTTDYDPADSGINVQDIDGFERETGGSGLIRVTPSSGAPFYLRYTNTSTSPTQRFTGVTADVLGTTAVAAVIGDRVEECLYVAGRPFDCVRKILCSTGTGTNGAYDTLPDGWSLAIPHDWLDHDDIDAHDALMGSFDYTWEIVATDAVTNGLSWIKSYLAKAGLFVAMRQGRLTLRCGHSTATDALPTGIEITDEDIARVVEYHAWDYQHSVEFTLTAAYYTDSTGDAVYDNLTGDTADTSCTLPSSMAEYDLTSMCFEEANPSTIHDIVDDVLGRTWESDRRVPERLTVLCAGLRLAQLTCGDHVRVTTTKAWSRADRRDGFVDRKAVVVGTSTAWSEGYVKVDMLIYPETDDVFG